MLSVSPDEELQLNGPQQNQMQRFYQDIKTTLVDLIEKQMMTSEDEKLKRVILTKMKGFVNSSGLLNQESSLPAHN